MRRLERKIEVAQRGFARLVTENPMRAVQLTAINQIEVREVPDPVLAAGEVLVKIAAAALNHRDVWIKLGQYAGLKFPSIPGSDGVGEVVAAGEGTDAAAWLGREAIEPWLAPGTFTSIVGIPRICSAV